MGSQCNRFVCFDNFVGRLSGRLLASCLFVPKTTNRQAIFWRVSAAFAGLSGMLQHNVLHIGCIFCITSCCVWRQLKSIGGRGLGLILNKLCTVNYKDCVGGNGGFKCWWQPGWVWFQSSYAHVLYAREDAIFGRFFLSTKEGVVAVKGDGVTNGAVWSVQSTPTN